MCGIIGYVGKQDAIDYLLAGLQQLEYRGYDSAGVALINNGIHIRKSTGRIANLENHLKQQPVEGSTGIAHTRWATHGAVTTINAHPHVDHDQQLAIVHNGVIENHAQLREQLYTQGITCTSQTDTEVLVHLIALHLKSFSAPVTADALQHALRKALQQCKGTYGVACVHQDLPGVIVAARMGSPLILGLGAHENFIASDAGAIASHTQRVIYLQDGDIVCCAADGFNISTLDGSSGAYEINTIESATIASTQGDYPHYMLKEIYEQPHTIKNAIHANLDGIGMTTAELESVERVILVGCGTAAHAAMVGKYLMEQLAGLPAEVEYASEFRYRNTPTLRNALMIVLSQSGETADTLAALRAAQQRGYRVLSICNNPTSTIARASDGCIYMNAGAEIGVAATKSFTSQCVILTQLAQLLGRRRCLDAELELIPQKVQQILELDNHIQKIAQRYAHVHSMLFMGRQYHHAVALEGALKMKEITYIHASGHPSAELKHGVIALIDSNVPSVFVAPHDDVFEKNLSNIEEVKARRGPVIGIGTQGCDALERVCDGVVLIPPCPDALAPLLTSIPLQLLAYHTAVALGRDVDRPRNLAKSVTVE